MKPNPPPQAPATPADAETQRRNLLDAQRRANQTQPRNFKEDALHDKVVHVEPDDTGPTPTESFDPAEDRHTGEARPSESHTTEGRRTGTRGHPSPR